MLKLEAGLLNKSSSSGDAIIVAKLIRKVFFLIIINQQPGPVIKWQHVSVPDMLCLYPVKNNQLANNSTTSKNSEKISTDLGS